MVEEGEPHTITEQGPLSASDSVVIITTINVGVHSDACCYIVIMIRVRGASPRRYARRTEGTSHENRLIILVYLVRVSLVTLLMIIINTNSKKIRNLSAYSCCECRLSVVRISV